MADKSLATSPWYYAHAAGHTYITPEDIIDAIRAGADKGVLHQEVLQALGEGNAEDWSLCAFVAARFEIERARS